MRRVLKLGVFIGVVVFLSVGGVVGYYHYKMFSSSKRGLSGYHYYWFEKLKESHLSLKYYKNRSYLIIKATSKTLSSTRFRLLRENFRHRGLGVERLNSHIVILLHGKNGIKEDLLPLAEKFAAMGFISIIPTLPLESNRAHKGVFNLEASFLDTILDDAKKHIDIHKKIAIWGFSLGGAYAILNVAHSKYRFSAIALFSTFDNLEYVIRDKSQALFGKNLGEFIADIFIKSLRVIDKIEIEKTDITRYAKDIDIPVLLIHGSEDKIVSYKRAKELYKSFASKKKFFIVDKSNHKSVLKWSLLCKSGFFLIKGAL